MPTIGRSKQRREPLPATRILVVDDNRDIADVLGRLLRKRGHDVHVAYDAIAGLEAARAQRPQLALLDVGLPDVDGYELARRIRADKTLGHVKLVAITGYGRSEKIDAAGFSDHVTKPFDLDRLAAIIASLPPPPRPPARRARKRRSTGRRPPV